MGFFDIPEIEPHDDEDEEEDPFDEARPSPWIGGVVGLDLVVARSAEAAVVVSRISAFPDGFELTVNSYLHRSVPRRRTNFLHHPPWHDGGDQPRDELLRFGIAWPDGGRATNVDGWGRSWPDATEPAHGLQEQSGGGSDREHSQQYWAWPLPGPGQLRFVAEWPAFGITETAEGVDAALLIEAAGRAQPVWPEDVGRASHPTRGGSVAFARGPLAPPPGQAGEQGVASPGQPER